jgi:hypothetical protein
MLEGVNKTINFNLDYVVSHKYGFYYIGIDIDIDIDCLFPISLTFI